VITKYGRKTALRMGLPLLLAAIVCARFFWPAAIVFGVLTVFVFRFFRDPSRRIPPGDHTVVSPADGKVVDVTSVSECPCIGGKGRMIGIFMSIFDAHVNRLPLDGKLVEKHYHKGRFHDARKPESSTENENITTVWQRPDGKRFVVRQIAGAIARTVVCEPEPGAEVGRGDPFGMVKFGSRAELYLPDEIRFSPSVTMGQSIRAGSSILGEVES